VFADMPASAIEHVAVDRVVPLETLAQAIIAAVADGVPREPPRRGTGRNDPDDDPDDPVFLTPSGSAQSVGYLDKIGQRSALTCPHCFGPLWELQDEGDQVLRYRCHTGHGFTASTLEEEQADAVESALWAAVRSLEDNGALARQMASRAEQRGSNTVQD